MRKIGNLRNGFLVLLVVFVTNALMAVSVSALEPSGLITAKGCTLTRDSFDSFSCWVKKDTVVTLTGPAGYTSYIWTGSSQNNQSTTIKVVSDMILTLTLDNTKVKTVQIRLLSTVTSCTLAMSGIAIGTTNLVVGQRVPISVDFDKKKCPTAFYAWTIDEESSSGLYIEDIKSLKTWLVVKSKPTTGKNPTIRFRAANGDQFHEENVTLLISDNDKPVIRSLSTTPTIPLSHRGIAINCKECFTGNGMNDAGDYIAGMSVTVKKVNGTFNQTFGRSFRKGSTGPISVSIGNKLENDLYAIEARIVDSHGAYSEIYFDTIFVDFGNTDRDVPYIELKEPVPCDGFECVFDTQEKITDVKKPGISRSFEVMTVSGKFEPLFSAVTGYPCSSPVCRTVFQGTGPKEIRIRERYIRNGVVSGKFSEKIVKVCIGCAENVTSAAASNVSTINHSKRQVASVVPVPTPETIIASTPTSNEQTKSTSGTSVETALFILILTAIALRSLKARR